MDTDQARALFAAQRSARLATVRPDGAPHLVPVTFAVEEDVIYTAVDAKPKRTQRLQRLANIEHEPRCTLLADRYDDDWSRLWWVRVDGHATVVHDPDAAGRGRELLTAKYRQYATDPPDGPVIVIHATRWSGWSAT